LTAPPGGVLSGESLRMIRRSGNRFADKIMR